mmetsp:Transcript_24186/g.52787  ORF Transcript_24186/g.52787 Transcript_24186/m.52787 type:complete len:192 (-) Transcript_24186:163-738(-)
MAGATRGCLGNAGEASTSKPRAVLRTWSERELILLAVQMSNEIPVCDHSYHFCTYEYSFIGKEVVNWMIESGVVDDDIEAVDLGNQMLRAGLIHHVMNDHLFKNQDLFYRFHLDRRSPPCVGRKATPPAKMLAATEVLDAPAPGGAMATHNATMAVALAETLAEERRMAAQREAELRERIKQLETELVQKY